MRSADPDDPERAPAAGPAGDRTGAFDSHLHLTDPRFDGDREEVLSRARRAGVVGMTTVATDPDDARRALELARPEPAIWATAGLHPHAAGRFSPGIREAIRELLGEAEIVAVGETGLDFHYDNAPRRLQRESFQAHLALAAEADLPVVVHSRDADGETAELIRDAPGVRGVLHCFTGGEELLEAGLEAGWYVSFSGILTFAPELEGRARRVPRDRLLVETDSPYLAPAPRRGRRNEPAYLPHTIEKLADLIGIEVEAAGELTRRNAERFYGVKVPGGGKAPGGPTDRETEGGAEMEPGGEPAQVKESR